MVDIEEDPDPDQVLMIGIDAEDTEIAAIVAIDTETKAVRRTESIQKTENKRRAVKNTKSKDVDLHLDQTHDNV